MASNSIVNNHGQELMTQSPSTADFTQLREIYIQSTWKEKKKEDGEEKTQPPT